MAASTLASCATTLAVTFCKAAASTVLPLTKVSGLPSAASCATMAVVSGVALMVSLAPAAGVTVLTLTSGAVLPVGSVTTTKNGATSPVFRVQV